MEVVNKKKKIKLITWLGNGNFGTTLQAYALYKKLKLMGYEVRYLYSFDVCFNWSTFIKYILYRIGIWKLIFEYRNIRGKKFRNLKKFLKSEFQTIKIFTTRDYKRLLNETDIFVTGSDQIWNAWHHFSPFYFLSFAGNKKRIAYASSIGTNSIPEKYEEEIKELLNKFSHIGVRETTAVEVLSKLTCRHDIVQVLDPTFLLTPSEWKTMSDSARIETNIPSKFIFCYLIGCNSNYIEQVETVKKKYSIFDVIVITSIENPNLEISGAIIYKNAGPREFVHLLNRATIVCTDSFHATALAINLSKDFVEFLRFHDGDKKSQNSRIYDLLNHYKLEYKLYSDEHEKWKDHINYIDVQKTLNNDRINSIEYLTKSI